MARPGLFDTNAVPWGWFDVCGQDQGWFDRDLLTYLIPTPFRRRAPGGGGYWQEVEELNPFYGYVPELSAWELSDLPFPTYAKGDPVDWTTFARRTVHEVDAYESRARLRSRIEGLIKQDLDRRRFELKVITIAGISYLVIKHLL
jgi:hypothetical protein